MKIEFLIRKAITLDEDTPHEDRRPHHRVGERYFDLADMGRDIENPAGI